MNDIYKHKAKKYKYKYLKLKNRIEYIGGVDWNKPHKKYPHDIDIDIDIVEQLKFVECNQDEYNKKMEYLKSLNRNDLVILLNYNMHAECKNEPQQPPQAPQKQQPQAQLVQQQQTPQKLHQQSQLVQHQQTPQKQQPQAQVQQSQHLELHNNLKVKCDQNEYNKKNGIFKKLK